MQFPVYLGPLHPHFVFETLGYLVAGLLYRQLRKRQGDHLDDTARGWVVVAAVLGGAAGSKLLYWLSDPAHAFDDPMGGKSVVGGLLGALAAVEYTKRRLGVTRATGDLFVLPILLGVAIGRIGCFLTGLADHTHGLYTSLPWAVDFGDGPRHPAQLYEVAFLMGFGVLLGVTGRAAARTCGAVPCPGGPYRRPGRPPDASRSSLGVLRREGDLFKAFMVGYLAFRLWLETLKPGLALLGLNAIQWLCLAALVYYGRVAVRRAHA